MNLKFPAWYSFHLQRDINSGKLVIIATDEKTKSNAKNRKFSDLKRHSWDGSLHFAIIAVEQIESEEELKEMFMRLHKTWVKPVEHPELLEG